ncbi:hypothetical protein GCM10007390_01920 [Persicitalea jodogahamensis]|uniref:META domain-containing protein n=1 Tax=Persicitalea jodogahamensis TaxID=402147 RepID=A0A8J3G726_9BACT|nr:hypothetical protein GCM10007390_01920 [Persicitalea jodogahamensis]
MLQPIGCKANSTFEGTWKLNAYQNLSDGTLQPDPDPDGHGVVLSFAEDGKSVSFKGHTVANAVSGSFIKDGSCNLANSVFGGTKVGEPTQWSNKVWSAMNSVVSYGQNEESLFIYFNDRTEVMIFSKVK